MSARHVCFPCELPETFSYCTKVFNRLNIKQFDSLQPVKLIVSMFVKKKNSFI